MLRDPKLAEIPVVVLSGMGVTQPELAPLGISAYLRKAFTLLIVDGGFRPGEPPTFHAAPPLTKQDLEELCARMERALVGIL
ncbi:MAG: hypothetical protein AB2A00_41400, partial [Myxococcota bacterium]